jgi:hypothetical protein
VTVLGPLPTVVLSLWTTFAVVGITDRRIAVFQAGRFKPAVPLRLVDTQRRRLRAESSGWPVWRPIRLGDRRFWVNRRFGRQLRFTAAA